MGTFTLIWGIIISFSEPYSAILSLSIYSLQEDSFCKKLENMGYIVLKKHLYNGITTLRKKEKIRMKKNFLLLLVVLMIMGPSLPMAVKRTHRRQNRP
jgi:hypothetical protein